MAPIATYINPGLTAESAGRDVPAAELIVVLGTLLPLLAHPFLPGRAQQKRFLRIGEGFPDLRHLSIPLYPRHQFHPLVCFPLRRLQACVDEQLLHQPNHLPQHLLLPFRLSWSGESHRQKTMKMPHPPGL